MKNSQHLVDEASLKIEYEKNMADLQELEQEAVFVVDRALKKDHVKIHSLTHRIKELPSFIDKCKRIKFKDPIRDMQDMVGLRVVCLYLSDIQNVLRLVKRDFDYVREADTIAGGDVSSFGYMSHHVIVQMKSTYKGPRYDSILGKPIEIQIRTILMDAWANVSHHLQYKKDSDVPTDLLRDFHALSGLFYVADTHFELFFQATQQSRERTAEMFRSTEPQKIEEEINADTLKAYLEKKFGSREQPSTDDLSSLVTELKSSQYKTIAQVDEDFEQAAAATLQLEKEVIQEYQQLDKGVLDAMPSEIRESLSKGQEFYAAAGMIRVALMLLNPEFLESSVATWEADKETKANAVERYNRNRERLLKKK